MLRMMRRQKIVPLVNRTIHPLEGVDDGIAVVVKPGYRNIGTKDDPHFVGAGVNGQPEKEYVPEATANRIINQNKKRGSVNPEDPLDAVFLLGVEGRDDISPVDYVPNPDAELIDRSMLAGEAARAVKVLGQPTRRSRRDRQFAAGISQDPAGLIPSLNRPIGSAPAGDRPFVENDA